MSKSRGSICQIINMMVDSSSLRDVKSLGCELAGDLLGLYDQIDFLADQLEDPKLESLPRSFFAETLRRLYPELSQDLSPEIPEEMQSILDRLALDREGKGPKGPTWKQRRQARLRRDFAGQWVAWDETFTNILVVATTAEVAYALGEDLQKQKSIQLTYEYCPRVGGSGYLG